MVVPCGGFMWPMIGVVVRTGDLAAAGQVEMTDQTEVLRERHVVLIRPDFPSGWRAARF